MLCPLQTSIAGGQKHRDSGQGRTTIADRDKLRRIFRFAGLCWGLIAVVLLAFWAVGLFRDLGLDRTGTVALIAGILFTCALAIALMSLVFYSAQSQTDEDAYRFQLDATRKDGDNPEKPKP